MTANEVARYLILELEKAGVPISNSNHFVDGHRNIVVEWDGGSSDFLGSLNKADMMQRIRSSVQNHIKFYLKKNGKREEDDGQ